MTSDVSKLCANCGESIKTYGPETFHIESTLIRCDIPGNDGALKGYVKAEAHKEESIDLLVGVKEVRKYKEGKR